MGISVDHLFGKEVVVSFTTGLRIAGILEKPDPRLFHNDSIELSWGTPVLAGEVGCRHLLVGKHRVQSITTDEATLRSVIYIK